MLSKHIAGTDGADYRPDIDGLRAIAVLGVLIFHARLGWLPGGYVGVDVFFVISGYLITKIIVSHDGDLGSFLARFYERRVRRLIPPALPVLAFTAMFAWYYLPPEAMQEFAKSALAYSFFVSNWFFLLIGGYDDGPSRLKPLLHTWSLGVEEQFYLLFPIPILIAQRWGTTAVKWLLAMILAASVVYSVVLVGWERGDDAFYNSFARFWEIALGGLLAVDAIRSPQHAHVRSAVGVFGLVAILASMWFYRPPSEMSFPGMLALVPTLGAAAVILAATGPASYLLATRPMVGVGLISYALYLWHWPLLVFVEYAVIGARPVHYMAALGVSALLATASYFLIEKPLRTRRILPTRRMIGVAFIASSAVIMSVSVVFWQSGGAPIRFPRYVEYAGHRQTQLQEQFVARLRTVCWVGDDMNPALERCINKRPGTLRVLIAGDSHAAQFYPALVAARTDISFSLLATDSCTLQPGLRSACDQLVSWIKTRAGDGTLPFDHIVMSARLDTIPAAKAFSDFAELTSQKVPVTVLGPIQYYVPNLPTMFPIMAGVLSQSDMLEKFSNAVQPAQFAVDVFLRKRLAGTRVNYISLLDVTCPGGASHCQHLDDEGMPVTIDNSHLSMKSAQAVIDAAENRLPF